MNNPWGRMTQEEWRETLIKDEAGTLEEVKKYLISRFEEDNSANPTLAADIVIADSALDGSDYMDTLYEILKNDLLKTK